MKPNPPHPTPTLDYQSPHALPVKEPMSDGCAGGLIGAGSLGCMLPLLLALYCGVVLGDMGGPLFWPILVVFGSVVGLVIGAIIGLSVGMYRKK
jgi:hypothetical protein